MHTGFIIVVCNLRSSKTKFFKKRIRILGGIQADPCIWMDPPDLIDAEQKQFFTMALFMEIMMDQAPGHKNDIRIFVVAKSTAADHPFIIEQHIIMSPVF